MPGSHGSSHGRAPSFAGFARRRTTGASQQRAATSESSVLPIVPVNPGSLEQALRLRCSSSSASARLVQICFVDHAGPQYASPHLHLQLLFSDRTRTPWLNVPGANVMALHQAVNDLEPTQRIRLHLHDPGETAPPNGGAASEQVVQALPRLTLTAVAAQRLTAGGCDSCPFCLEGFCADEEIIVWPCPGCHVTHASCSRRWLAVASTCPTCRFALPRELTASELATLLEPAERECQRIEGDALPLTCQPADDDEVVADAPTSVKPAPSAPAAASAVSVSASTTQAGGDERARGEHPHSSLEGTSVDERPSTSGAETSPALPAPSAPPSTSPAAPVTPRLNSSVSPSAETAPPTTRGRSSLSFMSRTRRVGRPPLKLNALARCLFHWGSGSSSGARAR
jgi:hypothetical protein